MTRAAVDTDVVVRLLTGDDPTKQRAAVALFESVERGELEITVPLTMIADCLYVLTSPRLYKVNRAEAVALLSTLVRLPSFKMDGKQTVLGAMDLFAATNLDFGDAMIVAAMRQSGITTLFSYDHDFDRIGGIVRSEPSYAPPAS